MKPLSGNEPENESEKLTIITQEKNIEISPDLFDEGIEEILISGCHSAELIDLSPLDKCPTLRAITISGNRAFERLVLPAECPSLENVIITYNTLRITGPTTVDPSVLHELRKKIYPYYDPYPTGTYKDKPTWIEKLRFWKELGLPDPENKYIPKPIDLSRLDGSPRLRYIQVTDNYEEYGVILPQNCPELEEITLKESHVVGWWLENCPKLEYVRLEVPHESRYNFLDMTPFLNQYDSPEQMPLIHVTVNSVRGASVILGYDNLPEEIKEHIVIHIPEKYRNYW